MGLKEMFQRKKFGREHELLAKEFLDGGVDEVEFEKSLLLSGVSVKETKKYMAAYHFLKDQVKGGAES